MSRDFSRQFYSSEAWNRCRAAYRKSVGGLCENCLKKGIYSPGEIVHHIEHITPANVETPEVTLDWRNLELLCRECHADIHAKRSRRFHVDEYGKITAI